MRKFLSYINSCLILLFKKKGNIMNSLYEATVSSQNQMSITFNLYAEYIMQDPGLGETQAGIKIEGSAGSQHGRSHPWQGHAKETWQARLQDSRDSLGRSHTWQGHAEETWRARRIRTWGTPWTCLSIYPKTRICLTILCLSPTLLTLTGGYPWPPFSEKSQLRALVNKSPGHDRSVSIQTPLMAF